MPKLRYVIKMESQLRERLSYVGESLLRLAFEHASSGHSVRCTYLLRIFFWLARILSWLASMRF